MALILVMAILAGCDNGSASGAPELTAVSGTMTPTSPDSGIHSGLEASIAMLRESGNPDEVRGSAAVISSDGYLITSQQLTSGAIEVVLPDGQVHRPVLVATEPAFGLALLKVPANDLTPVRQSAERMISGAPVYAAGFDGSPASIGRMGGTVLDSVEASDEVEYRVRGPLFIDTDITLVDGFIGGVLSDRSDGFSGVLVPGEDDDGRRVARAVSTWAVTGWLDSRQERVRALQEDAEAWERIELPDDWSIGIPEGWSASVNGDAGVSLRAELSPTDPDAVLQFSISVEPNTFGTDPVEFIQDEFADRSGVRVWGIERAHGSSLVRLTMTQEGALVDVAYLLDRNYLIAISLTSGYLPDDDHAQAERARVLFEVVLGTLAK